MKNLLKNIHSEARRPREGMLWCGKWKCYYPEESGLCPYC